MQCKYKNAIFQPFPGKPATTTTTYQKQLELNVITAVHNRLSGPFRAVKQLKEYYYITNDATFRFRSTSLFFVDITAGQAK